MYSIGGTSYKILNIYYKYHAPSVVRGATDCSIRVVAVTHQSVTELQWRHITTTTSSLLYCGGVVGGGEGRGRYNKELKLSVFTI